jgi:hypothetical protein
VSVQRCAMSKQSRGKGRRAREEDAASVYRCATSEQSRGAVSCHALMWVEGTCADTIQV